MTARIQGLVSRLIAMRRRLCELEERLRAEMSAYYKEHRGSAERDEQRLGLYPGAISKIRHGYTQSIAPEVLEKLSKDLACSREEN